jgi:hypothetical protein
MYYNLKKSLNNLQKLGFEFIQIGPLSDNMDEEDDDESTVIFTKDV